MPRVNLVNCWKPLRAENATTKLETAIVNAGKVFGLGNQHPSAFNMAKVQRPGLMSRRVQADPKREDGRNIAHKIWSPLSGNTKPILDLSGIVWYYSLANLTKGSAMEITLEVVERFHEKWSVAENGCWEWTGAVAGRGYGEMKIPGTRKQVYAHRLSYMIHHGEIPEGMFVCHACDNVKCVKPSHLFLGTNSDNHLDMKSKGRHLNGAKNVQSKLTDEKVRQMHSLSRQGLSQGKIAASFGVTQGTVWKILHGERWQHIFHEINGNKL